MNLLNFVSESSDYLWHLRHREWDLAGLFGVDAHVHLRTYELYLYILVFMSYLYRRLFCFSRVYFATTAGKMIAGLSRASSLVTQQNSIETLIQSEFVTALLV